MYFITGNKNKFNEIKSMLNNIKKIKQLKLDLPEIQEIDAKKIIKAKIKEALKHTDKEVIVEDTSLYLDCLNGLPGPLIKWFIKTIGINGIVDLVKKFRNTKAQARTIIGYAKNSKNIHFFEGTIYGTIVVANTKSDFGWDPIFKPKGYDKTFAEFSREEKNKISMRKIAIDNLTEFLESNN